MLDNQIDAAATRSAIERNAQGGEIVTAGGRVLNVTGLGPDPATARDRAYDAASRISFDGMQVRSDIAARAVARISSH